MKTQLRAVRCVLAASRDAAKPPRPDRRGPHHVGLHVARRALESGAINAEGVIEGWGVDAPMTVYLEEGAGEQDAEGLAQPIYG